LNKNQGKKQKLNAVAEKENTCGTIRVKTRVFLANKKRLHLLQKEHDVIQQFIAANKEKKLKTKTTDAPRKTHSA
jgi:hypothetical protein